MEPAKLRLHRIVLVSRMDVTGSIAASICGALKENPCSKISGAFRTQLEDGGFPNIDTLCVIESQGTDRTDHTIYDAWI
jgi:hypothetical protein